MTTTVTPATTPAAAVSRPTAAMSISRVSKTFRIPHQQHHTLKERMLHPLQGRTYDVLNAVDDVTVEIDSGEFFGIVGRNGSGKSTLLKCIAGIYNIDRGDLRVRGRLSPFIELGVGFNMELTARDNIMINAIMLGLTRKQARERFDQIIEFAELEPFLDLRLKNYSSGMTVRLAFSVAIQLDAEILLIDEVLAVGDAAFQQKCFDEFERLKRAGRTIVFVTHDMSAIERFCDRAMLLERGQMVAIGDPGMIARRYNQLNFGNTIHTLNTANSETSPETSLGGVHIVDAWFEDSGGERIAEVVHGHPFQICTEVAFSEGIENPVFGVTLRNEVGATIFATTTAQEHGTTGHFAAGETVVIRLRFENWLTASRYSVTPSVASAEENADALDLREDLASLVVHGGPFTGGVVNLPHAFEVERR